MKGHITDIELASLDNDNFRKVLYTAKNLQLVLMSLKPGEEIGEEIHNNDQFFRIESGKGKVMIDGNEVEVSDGDSIIIPAGLKHNVWNTDTASAMKMYTLYAPPHHKDGIVHHTKAEAQVDMEEFQGLTTE